MTEENLSLEALMKDLASTMKNLQEEISGLKKDIRKEQWALHTGRINALVMTRPLVNQNLTLKFTTRDGEFGEDNGVSSDAMGNTPKGVYSVNQGWNLPGDHLWFDYPTRHKQVDKIAPQTLNGLRLQCFHQPWHPSFPKKQWRRINIPVIQSPRRWTILSITQEQQILIRWSDIDWVSLLDLSDVNDTWLSFKILLTIVLLLTSPRKEKLV